MVTLGRVGPGEHEGTPAVAARPRGASGARKVRESPGPSTRKPLAEGPGVLAAGASGNRGRRRPPEGGSCGRRPRGTIPPAGPSPATHGKRSDGNKIFYNVPRNVPPVKRSGARRRKETPPAANSSHPPEPGGPAGAPSGRRTRGKWPMERGRGLARSPPRTPSARRRAAPVPARRIRYAVRCPDPAGRVARGRTDRFHTEPGRLEKVAPRRWAAYPGFRSGMKRKVPCFSVFSA